MRDRDRREFLKTGGAFVATGVMGLAASARAAQHGGQMAGGGGAPSIKDREAFVVNAREEGVCATCAYWGGVRKLSEDRQAIECESMGWCNNRKSRFFGLRTTPRTGPMASWKKWDLS